MTYSVLILDKTTGRAGVGVASGSIAVGSRVPWCRHGVACVATQAYTNPALGPRVLRLIGEEGLGADEALSQALSTDPEPSKRQVAVIDFAGRVACFTGDEAPPRRNCARGAGEGFAYVVAGNLLRNEGVVEAATFTLLREMHSSGDITEAILSALEAAAEAGGDARGERSAAILVVGETAWVPEYDRVLDVRVDYSDDPLRELRRIVEALKPPLRP